ncbi:MAG: hypothetical protein JWL70_175 [Acidimicrobiia bacterium]|nr:hypothetical protein [Acidimicrobiia bacterium]
MKPGCAAFADQIEELALGSLDEPTRTELLQHAAECSQCRARLDQLAWVTEQVLATAPEIEPPAGFEDRVLARLIDSGSVVARARSHSRSPSWRWLVTAAAAVALVVGGFSVGHWQRRSTAAVTEAVSSGPIQRNDGTRAGTIVLARTPVPHVLVAMTQPRPSTEPVQCILIGPDGRRTDVGSWTYADVEHGAWAVGIDSSLLGSARMEIVDARGKVLAAAALSPA